MEEVEDSSPFSECRKLRLWIREESWSERLKIKRKGVKEREGLSINKERLVWMITERGAGGCASASRESTSQIVASALQGAFDGAVDFVRAAINVFSRQSEQTDLANDGAGAAR